MTTFTTHHVRSADGTPIGFRRAGSGPAVVLVHGGLLASQHLVELASELAASFEVFVPDRRGRGMSGPYREVGRSFAEQEADDIRALLRESGAADLFGLSSGAIVCLEAVLGLSAVRRLALYEPPLSVRGSTPTRWLDRYERELAAGKRASALITGMRGLGIDPVLSRMPHLAAPVMSMLLKTERTSPDEVAIRDLVPTWHQDFAIIGETADRLDRYRNITADTLLLEGSRSPEFLHHSMDALQAVLPSSHRIALPKRGHQAPVDQPRVIAALLADFFRGRDASGLRP
ncbi:alpha/beta hydrolase [Planctomonas sp. JC2975]|uniref:alpha/beta fold hydrolase n=1 Tax=Planctomonas sp. JC2975 TaxID=2729626 RepID=UPI0014737391|nr:alpha/beta hydrolase [Planctomonas sp. JC2975]NNC10315.1 alpha/beta hydrolase [Planctomonas sp. JC2975]